MHQDNPIAATNATNIEKLIYKTMEPVSIDELKSFKQRVEFYLEHFRVLKKSCLDKETYGKFNYFNKLNYCLATVIDERVKTTI